MKTTLIALALLLAACDSIGTSGPPPFAMPPVCNSTPISTWTYCEAVPGATFAYSTMFGAPCALCQDAVGHYIGYVAQPGDPGGTQDLACFNASNDAFICVGACVPAAQDHRGCPP